MDCPIFISYSRKDTSVVHPLVQEIEAETGINCWIDLNGIESGDDFEDRIIGAIDKANVVIFMLSDNSMKSDYAKLEVNYARNSKKKVVPVVIDGGELRGWFLFKFGGIDFININDDRQKQKLFSNIKSWMNVTDNTGVKPIDEVSLRAEIEAKVRSELEAKMKIGQESNDDANQQETSLEERVKHIKSLIPYIGFKQWIYQKVVLVHDLYTDKGARGGYIKSKNAIGIDLTPIGDKLVLNIFSRSWKREKIIDILKGIGEGDTIKPYEGMDELRHVLMVFCLTDSDETIASAIMTYLVKVKEYRDKNF